MGVPIYTAERWDIIFGNLGVTEGLFHFKKVFDALTIPLPKTRMKVIHSLKKNKVHIVRVT